MDLWTVKFLEKKMCAVWWYNIAFKRKSLRTEQIIRDYLGCF